MLLHFNGRVTKYLGQSVTNVAFILTFQHPSILIAHFSCSFNGQKVCQWYLENYWRHHFQNKLYAKSNNVKRWKVYLNLLSFRLCIVLYNFTFICTILGQIT